MPTPELRQRGSQPIPERIPDRGAGSVGKVKEPHPAGNVKHGVLSQIARMLLFATWFNACCVAIVSTQLLGSPLYWYDRSYYYAYMARTKQSFGLVITSITEWFSPTMIRVSWDSELEGQLWQTPDGLLETRFPERLVLTANHQIYTDWMYLWWFTYTSRMHGYIYIILKESLKYIPVIGQGMAFYSFVFMARKWASDKTRMQYRLKKLTQKHGKQFAPMWLLIFPEGTNLSANTRKRSRAWAEHEHIPDLKHLLLPRSTGLQLCLDSLRDSVDYIYDCTVAYEGVPPGGYAQDYFTLRSTWFQGRPPKSVNMYWRRFALKDIPVHDPKAFEAWTLDCWREKDRLMDHYYTTGRFPSSSSAGNTSGRGKDGYIETQARLRTWYEAGQIFVVLATTALVLNVFTQFFQMFK